MKTPLLASSLALAARAVALVVSLSSGSGDGPTSSAAVQPAAPAQDEGLLARLDELAEESGSLRERIALLELRPMGAAREEAGEGEEPFLTRAEFEAFREELEARLVRAGFSAGLAKDDGEFQARVAESLKAIQKDRNVEAANRKLEGATRAIDEKTMPAMREWLGLTPGQEPLVREALLRKADRDRELVRMWQEGNHTDQELGAIKGDNRQAHLDEMAGVLDAEQYERFSSRSGGKD